MLVHVPFLSFVCLVELPAATTPTSRRVTRRITMMPMIMTGPTGQKRKVRGCPGNLKVLKGRRTFDEVKFNQKTKLNPNHQKCLNRTM